MSLAALERLENCQRALIDALDEGGVAPLEAALDAMRAAIDDVRAAGAWRQVPDVPARAARIKGLAEAARVRVNILTDLNRQRLDAVAALRGAPRPTYARPALVHG